MRGTVITWNGERGVISAGGQRHDFDINHWRSTTAPAANMTVEATMTDGKLADVAPVNEADLAKEKPAAMTGKGEVVAKALIAGVGMDIAIAYGVFLMAALVLNFVSGAGMIGINLKLTDLLSESMGVLGRGRGIFLVLLATATIAVPFLWKHKLALLAFALPLVITIMGFWPLYEDQRQQQHAVEAMSEFGDHLGLGAYVAFASAIYLAFRGVMKFLGRG
jgi:hypothetical protein